MRTCGLLCAIDGHRPLLRPASDERRIIPFTLPERRPAEPHDSGVVWRTEAVLYEMGGRSRSGRTLGWRWAIVGDISELILVDEQFRGSRLSPSGRHVKWEVLFATVSPPCGVVAIWRGTARYNAPSMRACTFGATAAVLVVAATCVACSPRESAGQYPSQPIELVVPFQAGGGSDTLARTIQAIAAEERLVSVPITVVNRTGGAGAVGLAYVAAKRADAHTLMTMIDTALAVPLQPAYTGPSYRDLTVIAVLALDDMLVVVPARSAFRTMDQLIAHAKANPGKVTLATNAAGGEDHIFGGMIERATGAKFSYVHTRGGAEAMQNVMGGHVDVAVPNPSETLGQLQGGLVRVLAVASAERLKVLPEVPTLKERGIDVEYQMFRGIAMPSGVSAEVVAYWSGVLEKVTRSERWKRDYIQKLELTPHFRGPTEALTFLASVEQTYRSTLKDLRVIN